MRLRIATGFGIPVYVHWTFLFLPLLILWRPTDSDFSLAAAFTLLPLIFACVVLHEFGHALMARRFGIKTHDVTLYPIGGVARLAKMPEKPLEEFLIAVAGPAVNVVLAILLSVVLGSLALFDYHLVVSTFAGHIGLQLLAANVFLFMFNLVPAFPMDGGRVLRALLAAGLGHYQGTQVAVGVGLVVALLLAVVGMIVLPFSLLPVVMGFVMIAGLQELAVVRAREQQRRWDAEEPLEVLPVRPLRALDAPAPGPALMFQPKIAIYSWDQQTGTWRQDTPP
jgi:Zn-dependent protease